MLSSISPLLVREVGRMLGRADDDVEEDFGVYSDRRGLFDFGTWRLLRIAARRPFWIG